MKKALITGASGTVGKALTQYLQTQSVDVVAWDREAVSSDDYHAMENYVRAIQPDVLFHLAVPSNLTGRPNESWHVNYEWTSELAWITHVLGVTFVYTSTVMVFSNQVDGPFTPSSQPTAEAGYGYEKRRAEEQVFHQNPNAIVARLGWQIGQAAGSNNMVDFLSRQANEHGEIRASTRWYPACSFLEDTAAALYTLAQGKPGLYLVDSNDQWTFYDIVQALKSQHDELWDVVETGDFVHDQRMIDSRVPMPRLQTRLPALSDAVAQAETAPPTPAAEAPASVAAVAPVPEPETAPEVVAEAPPAASPTSDGTELFDTMHPEGKHAPTVLKSSYDAIKTRIIAYLEAHGTSKLRDITADIERNVTNLEKSTTWYVNVVKLDLEARGIIERVPNKSPQQLRLK